MAPFQCLSPSTQTPIEPVIAPFVLPSSMSPHQNSLDTPLPPLTSAKYLGPYITPTSSSVPDVNCRCSQASSAFKTLDPFFAIKFRVYSQIVQAILLHGSEYQVFTPAPITRIDSLHCKAPRQIFHTKSPNYHHVISPTDSP